MMFSLANSTTTRFGEEATVSVGLARVLSWLRLVHCPSISRSRNTLWRCRQKHQRNFWYSNKHELIILSNIKVAMRAKQRKSARCWRDDVRIPTPTSTIGIFEVSVTIGAMFLEMRLFSSKRQLQESFSSLKTVVRWLRRTQIVPQSVCAVSK